MTCETIRNLLDRYADGELEDATRRQVEGHLRVCPPCTKELTGIQELFEATSRTLTPIPAPPGFDAAVMTAVTGRRSYRWAHKLSPGGSWWARAGWAFAVLLIGYTAYVANLERIGGDRRLVVMGQNNLAWSSPASFRVMAYENLRDQSPLAGTPVVFSARRKNAWGWRTLYRGRTNAHGSVDASFRMPADLEGECVLRVQSGGLLERDVVEQPITVERKARALLSTDKPLYQPGQTMHLRVLAMDLGARTAAAERPVTLEVKEPKGTIVFRKELKTSRFGITAADFRLADLVSHGRYQVVARVGEDETEKTVTVKPYVLPKFRVDVRPGRPYYSPGDTLDASVKGVYFFGKPVAGARVKVRLSDYTYGFNDFATINGKTDANGDFEFETRLPTAFAGIPLQQGDALVRMSVEVTDASGHLESVSEAVPVANRPFRVAVVPEGGEPAWGIENLFYVVTSYPDGTVARTSGEVLANGRRVHFQTDASGIAAVRLPVGLSSLRMVVTAADARNQRVDEKREWQQRRREFGAVLVRTDSPLYQVGETMNVEVLTSGQATNVYLDVVRGGQTVLTRTAPATNGRARFALDLSDDLSGTLALHAYYLPGLGDMIRDTRLVIVRAGEQLKVALEPEKEVTRPGEEARVRVRLTDADGQPVPGAVGLAAVDESVFALREQDAGLEQDHFEMERAIMEPRFEEHFSLPPAFAPSRVLHGPAPERRAAVTLAAFTSSESTSPGRSGGQAAERPATTPEYRLHADSVPLRQQAIRRHQERYFRGLWWSILLLSMLGSSALIIRRNPWGMLWVLPLFVGSLGIIGTSGESGLPWAAGSAAVSGLLGVGIASRIKGIAEVAVSIFFVAILAAILFPVFSRSREAARAGAETMSAQLAPRSAVASMPMDRAQSFDGAVRNGVGMPGGAPAGALEPPRVREFFPETLFWQPEVITNDAGDAVVTIPAADSITEWRLSAVGSTADGRVGSASTGMRVFQEFFIDPDLPVTLTQHDEVTIPVAVHNYLPKPQTIRISLRSSNWFRLRGPAEQRLTLGANSVGVVRFPITASRFGKHTLELTGIGSSLSDAIKREIEVLPDGEEVVDTTSDRLEGTTTVPVEFAPGTIRGTERLVLKLHPGTLSQVVDGLDGLLSVPFG